MIYVLDTNTISDLIEGHQQVISHLSGCITRGDTIHLCQPVFYEVMRGLFWRNLRKKQVIFRGTIRPQLDWVELIDDDWFQAALFWSSAKSHGRQLSDIDVLIASLAHRLNAIVVSGDADFDALPVTRENWRLP
ncbi:MAG: PIN domain-containing protein [Chloroflexota bacterium]